MKYYKIKNDKDEEFQRLSGVKRSAFKKMIEILEEAEKKKVRSGKPNSLPMTLEYRRDYRTYLHVASSYKISESSGYRNIK